MSTRAFIRLGSGADEKAYVSAVMRAEVRVRAKLGVLATMIFTLARMRKWKSKPSRSGEERGRR